MNKIIFPLTPRMKSSSVADLQDALQLLMASGSLLATDETARLDLSTTLTSERSTQFYGSTTQKLVMLLQQEQGLQANGAVEEATANAINRLIKNGSDRADESREEYSVHGQVAEPGGVGINNLTVRAFDKCLSKENELGTANTDADGRYSLTYKAEQLLNPARKQADLVVRVFSRADGLQTSSPLIVNALLHEIVNFVIGDEAYRGPTFYQQIHLALAEYLEGEVVANIEPRDLYCLANNTQLDIEIIQHYVLAQQGQTQFERLPAEAFFAWFRSGLPTQWASLFHTSVDELVDSIEHAAQENIISRDILGVFETLDTIVLDWRTDYVIMPDNHVVSDTSLGRLLESSTLDTEQRRSLIQQWQTFDGDVAEFWQIQRQQLGQELSRDLDLTLQLGTLTRNHLALVKALKTGAGISRFAQVAGFTQQDWLALFETAALEMPADLLGEDVVSQRQAYAEALTEFTELLLPTAVLAESFRRDSSFDSEQLDRFFQNNPDFEFRSQSVRAYLQEKPNALADFSAPKEVQLQLEALQRVFHLSPASKRQVAAKVLWQNQLHSAWAIMLKGEDALFDLFAGEPLLAKKVYRQAQFSQQISYGISLHKLDHSFAFAQHFMGRLTDQGSPDLESLFGGLDYCACAHCASFFSPSAYLVDLLLYLHQAKLTGLRGTPAADENTVLERLFKRRPDLGNIELNCENALTPLPYIDLVNEILENAVSPRSYSNKSVKIVNQTFTLPFPIKNAAGEVIDPVPQTSADGDVLKAFPQHLNPLVYQTLHQGEQGLALVYPWNLPFNVWAVEVRTYVEHLGVPRWQLMGSMPGQQSNNVDIACEYLGLTSQGKAILLDANPGTSKLVQYWGVGESDDLSALAKVEAFLKHSDYSYDQLGQLLELRYIQNAYPAQNLQIIFDPQSSCQVVDARLEPLNEAYLSRIHRFARLQRKTAETPITLDQSLMALGGEINDVFLEDYATVQRIQLILPRKIIQPEILSWWNVLDTHDYVNESSLYRTLFLNVAISQPVESLFSLHDVQNELNDVVEGQVTIVDLLNPALDPDLTAHLLAALQWSMPQLADVVTEQWQDLSFDLNLANLSYFYRVSSFCRALRIPVTDYLALKAVSGMVPLPGPGLTEAVRPATTLEFVLFHQLIRELNIDPDVFNYILCHQFRVDAPFILGGDEIAQVLLELQLELNNLLNQSDPAGISLAEKTQIKLSLILAPEEVATFKQIIEKDANIALSVQEQQNFVDEKLTFFRDTEDAKVKLVNGSQLGSDDRYGYVLDKLAPYLVENAVVQRLAESLQINTELTDRLLRTYLPHPLQPQAKAIEVFFTPIFLDLSPLSLEVFNVETLPEQFSTLISLHKINLLANSLALTPDIIGFIMQSGFAAGLPDLSQLPITPNNKKMSAENFVRWRLLIELVRIDQSVLQNTGAVFDILRVPHTAQLELLERLSAASRWDINDLIYLAGSAALSLTYPADYQSGDWLVALANIMPLVTRIGSSAQQIAQWASPDVTAAQALSVRLAVKAKYGEEQWLQVTVPLRDRIREQQRDALLGFVLHHRNKHNQGAFTDVNDLYGYYLIDPQMSACTMTSRTVLASSSIQLFVQRIMMNLDDDDLSFARNHAQQWKWRKYYRVWEANRKVYLWPENWIEPELRDDKSPFFEELENELLQDELNEETVERVFVNYLHKLDEVARLEICAVHYEEGSHTLHVFGRTAGTPSFYYYRRWENRRNWSAWEKVELDIHNAESVEELQTGVSLLPLVHNRRLFLFWPIFTLKKGNLSDEKKSDIAYREFHIDNYQEQKPLGYKAIIQSLRDEIQLIEQTASYYQVKMSWSEYRQGQWTATKVSTEAFHTPKFEDAFANGNSINRYFFLPNTSGQEGELIIKWYYLSHTGVHYRLHSFFVYNSSRNELQATIVPFTPTTKMKNKLPDWMWYMKAKDDAVGSSFPLKIRNASNEVDELLSGAAKHHLLSYSLSSGVRKQTTPLIYEDKQRTFLVVPPLPVKHLIADISTVSSQMLAGKVGGLQSQAFQKALKPILALQDVEDSIQAIEKRTATTGFFQRSESNQVIVRPVANLVDTSHPNKIQTTTSRRIVDTAPFVEAANVVSSGVPSNIKLRPSGDYVIRSFYHPYSCLFLKQLNRYGVEGLLNPNPETPDGKTLSRQATPEHKQVFNFAQEYTPNWNEVNRFDYPEDIVTFNYDDAYANYNWELFFHIPLLIATRLSQDQRFEVAQRWFHYIFNPTETEGIAPERFWKIKPFHSYTKIQMESDLDALLKGESKSQIQAWQEDPFNPHLLARFRRLVYMKTTVMKYLDNLLGWGDQLFRQDSIESLNEATQLYVLAGQILGKLPVATEAKKTQVATFNKLADELNELSNAWVNIEMQQQSFVDEDSLSNDFNEGNPHVVPYFCFAPNEKLLTYWETVAERLFKIRHCMNIEGLVRQLPLFQPPIDPALLVRAAASGMDVSSAVNDLYAPLPHYRFTLMLQKAQEICLELKSLSGALLSVLEKKDAEALSLIRTQQETALLKASKEIKASQIIEAKRNFEGLIEQKELSRIRFENYQDRDFINSGELAARNFSVAASISQIKAAKLAIAATEARRIPDLSLTAHTQGFASGVSTAASLGIGGSVAGSMIDSYSKSVEIRAMEYREDADRTSTFAQYERRQEDWDLQIGLAKQELKQIDKQILAAEIRIAIAEKDKENLELHISQSQTVADFMKNKYTDQQLYGWMVGQLASVYFQTYQLAFDIAKQAEKTFRFELGIENSSYIQFGYWDNLRKGLLSGEKLSLDIRRLEMAYFAKNRREYELTKHVSLRQLDPIALLTLKSTGVCEISVPEWLFDLHAPGHYMRRIKNVSLSIPAVAGPYAGVTCTLSLVKSKLRRSPLLKDGSYAEVDEDDRFIVSYGPMQSIVTSHAQNDGGLFETNLRDERFLPFEGQGVVSNWKLELPGALRQFDYHTMADVVLHIRYTAREGGALLRQEAEMSVRQLMEDVSVSELTQLFSLNHEFSSEWQRFVTSNENSNFSATIKKEYFPYLAQNGDITIIGIELYALEGQVLRTGIPGNINVAAISTALQGNNEFEISFAEDEVLIRERLALVFMVIRYAII